MSRLFEDILKEQKYNNTKRIYYHGSKSGDLTDLQSFSRDAVFLTIDSMYAAQYATKDDGKGWVYMCRVINPLKIFNARASNDRGEIIKFLRNDEEFKEEFEDNMEEFDEAIEELMDCFLDLCDKDWLDVFIERKTEYWTRYDFCRQVKRAGFDGFFNYETHGDLANRPSLGLFTDPLPINDSYSYPQPDVQLLKKCKVERIGKTNRIQRDEWEDIEKFSED